MLATTCLVEDKEGTTHANQPCTLDPGGVNAVQGTVLGSKGADSSLFSSKAEDTGSALVQAPSLIQT